MERIESPGGKVGAIDDARVNVAIAVANVVVAVAVTTVNPLIIIRISPPTTAVIQLLIVQFGERSGWICCRSDVLAFFPELVTCSQFTNHNRVR